MVMIGLVDADLVDNGTRHPNLALMKISTYCKQFGQVMLLFGDELNNVNNYDLIIISKVFSYTKLPDSLLSLFDPNQNLESYNTSIVESVDKVVKNSEKVISIGGTGFFEFGGRNLDKVIEHSKPDYDLYNQYIEQKLKEGYKDTFDDYKNYSIGFTTRGCFRKCSFCVNQKYSRSFINSPVSEFLDEKRPRIYLWDDNFLSFGPGWEKILQELNMTGKPFQFRQGLDIRLISYKKARILSQSNYYGDYIFAFDHIEDKDLIEKRLTLWRKYCKKTTKLYVLCGYSQTHSGIINPGEDLELKDIIDTLERISILMSFGCLPYIMRYEDYKFSRFKDLYIQLARWCNQPQFFKKKSFREFCEANQYYTKSNKNCRSYKTMLNFYQQYPDIASKYFELKYETVNEYDLSYSYARIKSEPCRRCYSSSITWDKALSGNNMGWIEYYFDRSLDIICLTRTISCCKSKYDINAVCSLVFRTISSSSLNDLFKILDSFPISSVDIAMVPQFSNFEDATVNLINIFLDDESLSFEEIGNKLRSGIGNLDSFKKYGENHSKLAALLDLVVIREADHKQFVSLSPVGKYLKDTTYSEILNFSTKQILRIPIIQQLIIHSKVDEAFIEDIIALSGAKPSTIKRRTSSIKYLIDLLFQVADPDSARRLINIKSKN